MGMDMDMGSGTEMTMTFFTSTTTPLYSTAWTPGSTGQYAGTCIFLATLSIVLRGLLALKAWREAAWVDAALRRRYVSVAGRVPKAAQLQSDSDSARMVLSANGVEEDVVVVQRRGAAARPWRLSVDPLRAVFDVAIVGVSYLLMLGAMTMNVGYFLSILAGVFVGSLALGRYTLTSEH